MLVVVRQPTPINFQFKAGAASVVGETVETGGRTTAWVVVTRGTGRVFMVVPGVDPTTSEVGNPVVAGDKVATTVDVLKNGNVQPVRIIRLNPSAARKCALNDIFPSLGMFINNYI
jgi:hypothetical protein